VIIAALILGFSSGVQARFEKQFEISLPTKGPIHIAQFDPQTSNVAFTTPALAGKSNLYLLQNKERRVLSLGLINYVFGRVDCLDGILGIGQLATGSNRIYFYRMTDGLKIGEMLWNDKKRRIGKIVQDGEQIVDLNGRLIVKNPTPDFGKPLAAYLGILIWNGQRRLSIVGRGDVPNDAKDVVELSGDWKKGNRHWMSNYAMVFDHVLGNPDTGAFAVFERNSRDSVIAAIYTKDFKRIPGDTFNAISIGPNGIICCNQRLTGSNELAGTGEFLCLDANSGALKWRGKQAGSWFGDYLIANVFQSSTLDFWPGQAIISGKTGKVIGKMPMEPKGMLVSGKDGNYCYSVSKSNSLMVYRMSFR